MTDQIEYTEREMLTYWSLFLIVNYEWVQMSIHSQVVSQRFHTSDEWIMQILFHFDLYSINKSMSL